MSVPVSFKVNQGPLSQMGPCSAIPVELLKNTDASAPSPKMLTSLSWDIAWA